MYLIRTYTTIGFNLYTWEFEYIQDSKHRLI